MKTKIFASPKNGDHARENKGFVVRYPWSERSDMICVPSRRILFVICLAVAVVWSAGFSGSSSVRAEVYMAPDAEGDGTVSRHAVVKAGFESINLPTAKNMGTIGTTYLVEIGHGFYFGPAIYGAVTGEQGGFFTLGGELAWHYPLFSKIELQTGIYVGGGGGGGGASSLWGGGLMLRPHADLVWDFGIFKAGVTASHVSFPDGGDVHSNQIGLTVAFDTDFRYFKPDNIGRRVMVRSRQGLGGDRLMAVLGSYFPKSGVQSSDDTMGFVGVRYERFATPWLYFGVEGAGAFSGDADGYAEYLGTLGVETPVFGDRVAIGARAAAGMSGGGGVSVGGGFIGKLGVYATYNINPDIHLSLEGGYAAAPDGDFEAAYCSANLGFDLDHPFASGTGGTVEGYEFSFGTLHYFSAETKNGETHDVDLITLKANRYLNEYLYLTGQAHSAYLGNSGAFSVGMIGIGLRSAKFAERLTAGAEMLAGAAGGASLDTEGGLVLQPMAYLGLKLTPTLGVKLGAGQIISVKGDLNSTVADLALSFEYGAAGR